MSQYTVVTHLRKEGTSLLLFPLASLHLPLSKQIWLYVSAASLIFMRTWGTKRYILMLDVIYKLLFLEKKARPYYKLQQLKTYFHLKCIQTKTQNSKLKIKRKTINQQIFINMQYLQMTKLAVLCLKVTLSSPTETNFITRLSYRYICVRIFTGIWKCACSCVPIHIYLYMYVFLCVSMCVCVFAFVNT